MQVPDRFYIDDYSFLEADNSLYLIFSARKDDCNKAKIQYNTKGTLLLQRNNSIFIFQDIPTNIRKKLITAQSITVSEVDDNNKNFIRGYELTININTNIPDKDELSKNFDDDFSFLTEFISDKEYEKYKNNVGF